MYHSSYIPFLMTIIKHKNTPIDIFGKIFRRKEGEFIRKTGMNQEKFGILLGRIRAKIAAEEDENKMKQRGLKGLVTLENQLLIALYYLRSYGTHLLTGEHFGVCESYSSKIYTKMKKYMLQVLELPKKTDLPNMDLSKVIIDVTEQEIERPIHKQKKYYSGKKHKHTLKVLIFICATSLSILAVRTDIGTSHDFNMFKENYKPGNIQFKKEVEFLADSGFQGIKAYHENSRTPYKATKNHPVTKEKKKFNQQLAKERIPIEHTNRKCKIFHIVKDVYRGKHKNFGMNWNLIAMLVNFSYYDNG